MSKVRNIIRLYTEGVSKQSIGERTGLPRNTPTSSREEPFSLLMENKAEAKNIFMLVHPQKLRHKKKEAK